ncbi:hypothetical protein E3Q23_04118 [Wallemia mellicola]|uniref:WD40 repeat-like protein n=1 Tax=Wallemia mellicola TaxID=1708541 RepID=A0A4T0QTK0_9BASI|nr:hypothetical protein E3Q23_04118 [Wallemia mellicola]TIC09292.1 WD40 repeat-like protein [Wallemia mellicola]TIC28169.1 WD40 repeat-like protein [Wallemia mellicola]TIC62096.1 WD40 repeat-like protein [Wallemia mellicola]
MFIRAASRISTTSARNFSASAYASKDLVQELYLSQLKSYKAPPKAADAHVGHVKTFKQPETPAAPSVPTDLATELSSYEAAQPTFNQPTSTPAESANAGENAEEFLAFLEADLPKPEDFEVTAPPTDGVSCLAFSPTADILAVGSWDNNVRIYEVQPTGQTIPKFMYSHEQPVLSLCWTKDGGKLISAGADNAARMFDLSNPQNGQSSQVAQHDKPIKCVRWIETPTGGILATGSWDKTIKYWSLGNPTPVGTVQLPERLYSMDVVYPLLVAATAERRIVIINLSQPTTIFRELESPLKWQTRVISCFPSGDGYAVGSIEGRVAIQSKDGKEIYPVNDITFHQQHGTYSTCGSDGSISFWDKDSKTRLKNLEINQGPIPCTAFNAAGTIFAYALSYDWSKGFSKQPPQPLVKIMLHATNDEEVKRRPPKK